MYIALADIKSGSDKYKYNIDMISNVNKRCWGFDDVQRVTRDSTYYRMSISSNSVAVLGL